MLFRFKRALLLGGSAVVGLGCLSSAALSQSEAPAKGPTALPGIEVDAPQRVQPARPPRARVASSAPRRAKPAAPSQMTAQTAAQAVAAKNESLDAARQNTVAPTGATTSRLGREQIQALPQGTDAPLDKVLLQFPGVSQDSAAAGELHVRNEHANVQYRINGIMIPDGVGAFGQILDTGIVGGISLLTGALPAQYGLRTAGVLDIQTRANAFDNSGTISMYGGAHGTVTPSFEYGGTAGQTQYYISGRYFGSDQGIENPTSSRTAIHDHTDQAKGFAYVSTAIDDNSRLVFMGGTSTSTYQIPNNPGQPAFSNLTAPFDSANLNEHQTENNQFGILAYQRSFDGLDTQLSAFTRYSSLHFTPDVAGDLAFNGVASDVYRRSQTTGIASDNAYRWSDAHTLRFGFQVSGEQTRVGNTSTVFPVDANGDIPDGSSPLTLSDTSAKLGWLLSTYASDEWKITNQVTLTTGLRFDQMYSYTDANQFSPRVSVTYQPFQGTTFHAGYARNFTPPSQVLAAPTNIAITQGTTQQPAVSANDPVQPERSNVFDVGVDQTILPGFTVGIDAYYKTARDLLDDGQFGAAYVLSAFNYDRAENIGVELKSSYTSGNFRIYGNLAWAKQTASNVVSNQYLFGLDELAYIATHSIFTDHAQLWTASAGASYLWKDTRFSASMIYGSGLRSGFANTDSLPSYTQVNLGVSHDFFVVAPNKPTTLRLDLINAFDTVYQIRDGSGIGVFAPQYGPRRGLYAGISQKF
ncbi:MAG: TonB-dependent receptor [Tardiphaga sp.]|jgi:outer membrane receptor protein involved in Fe transport|nr:TonB-dependent receptor [Tardiphaga sp.]